jgi:hypothetical protein
MRRREVLATTIGAVVATALASGIAWAATPGSEGRAAQQATKPSITNDGLPKQWFGVTKWKAGNSGVQSAFYATTVAEVTLTLAKKSSKNPYVSDGSAGKTGTFYEYRPTGKITVAGWCPNQPITVPLKPLDGLLVIVVPKKNGKRVRAAYAGYDFSTLGGGGRQPIPCPDGTYDGGDVGYWGFRTEFTVKPAQRYKRSIGTTAAMIKGSYLENDTLAAYQPLDKYEWCFVRARRDLGKCR